MNEKEWEVWLDDVIFDNLTIEYGETISGRSKTVRIIVAKMKEKGLL